MFQNDDDRKRSRRRLPKIKLSTYFYDEMERTYDALCTIVRKRCCTENPDSPPAYVGLQTDIQGNLSRKSLLHRDAEIVSEEEQWQDK